MATVHCPDCLRDDKGQGRIAQFRAAWALAAEIICSAHQIFSHKQCPRCGLVYRYVFAHAAGVWRACCDLCGLSCDATPGTKVSVPTAFGIEFKLSFEASLGRALRGEPTDRGWTGSSSRAVLLRVVDDLGRAIAYPANVLEQLPIERLQKSQFPVFRRCLREERVDAPLPHLSIESRRSVFATIAVMLRPDLARHGWLHRHNQAELLQELQGHPQPEDRSTLLIGARAWPDQMQRRLDVQPSTSQPARPRISRQKTAEI